MKKRNKLMVCATIFTMLSEAMSSFAGEWKTDAKGYWYEKDDGGYAASEWMEDNGRWYYIGNDGYMVSSTWVGDYYVGVDGAMFVNTTTPDGYQVGADGKWIQTSAMDSRPIAAYCNLLDDSMFYKDLPGHHPGGQTVNYFFRIYSETLSDWVDCGSYYQLNNQKLYNYKTHNTQNEAKQSAFYKEVKSHATIQKFSNGKFIVRDEIMGECETVAVYAGPIYVDKNVIVEFTNPYAVNPYDIITCTLNDYFMNVSGVILGTEPAGSIYGVVTQIDSNGYVLAIRLIQAE